MEYEFTSAQRDEIEMQLRDKGITDIDAFMKKATIKEKGECLELQRGDVVVKVPLPSPPVWDKLWKGAMVLGGIVIGGFLVVLGIDSQKKPKDRVLFGRKK